jgi:hypothetical protein
MFNYFAWSFKQMRRCNADFAFVARHLQALFTIRIILLVWWGAGFATVLVTNSQLAVTSFYFLIDFNILKCNQCT